MAAPIVPIPLLLQAEIDRVKASLIRIGDRVHTVGNQTNVQIAAQRVDLQMQAEETHHQLTILSQWTEGLDENVVRLRELIDERLQTLNQMSYNIFNVLSLLAWKEIFFAVYIRSILKVLTVLLVILYAIIYFSSWSASQHVAGWAEDYTTLHGRAYSNKIPYPSSVYAPVIPTTGYHSLKSFGDVAHSHSGVSTIQGKQSPYHSVLLTRSAGVDATIQEARNSSTKSWWWQRRASMPVTTPNSTADTGDAGEVEKLREVSSLIKNAIDQLKEQVASSVLTSKDAMEAKDGREEMVKHAEASAEHVLEKERILRELIDRFSSLIDNYVSARAHKIREEV